MYQLNTATCGASNENTQELHCDAERDGKCEGEITVYNCLYFNCLVPGSTHKFCKYHYDNATYCPVHPCFNRTCQVARQLAISIWTCLPVDLTLKYFNIIILQQLSFYLQLNLQYTVTLYINSQLPTYTYSYFEVEKGLAITLISYLVCYAVVLIKYQATKLIISFSSSLIKTMMWTGGLYF